MSLNDGCALLRDLLHIDVPTPDDDGAKLAPLDGLISAPRRPM